MKTEKLKQNVKGYVHQFEDGGLRLLRKGQKGVIHAIFSRFGLVLILLLLQVGLLFSIFRWFGNLWPHYFGGSVVVTSAMVIYLLNSKMDNSARSPGWWWLPLRRWWAFRCSSMSRAISAQHPAQTAAGAGGPAARLAAAKPKGRGAAESA